MRRLRSAGLALLAAAAAAAAAAEEAAGTCSAASGLCGAGGGPGIGAYYWPTHKGSAARTGYFDYEVPKLGDGIAWSWSDPYVDVVRATPLIDEQKNIYLTTIAGRIYKFNAMGVILWEKKVSGGIPTIGSLYNDTLFVGTKSGDLLALDLVSGLLRWRAVVSEVGVTAADAATIFAQSGTVVMATHTTADTVNGNTDVVGVSSEDGRILWRFQPDQVTRNLQVCSPGDDTIIFQDQVAGLYRLGLANGSLIWKSQRHTRAISTLGAATCHGDTVYTVINEGHHSSETAHSYMEAHAVDTGRWLWQVWLPYAANQAVTIGPHPRNQSASIAVVGVGALPRRPPVFDASFEHGAWIGQLVHQVDRNFPWIFGERKRAVLAYDAALGRRLWHFELEPYGHAAAAGDSERVQQRFAEMTDGTNPDNEPMCLPVAGSAPVIGPDGTIYMGWQDGRIYAIKDANGDSRIDPEKEVTWRELGDAIYGSLAMAPGMLVAAPCGGGLHVFKS